MRKVEKKSLGYALLRSYAHIIHRASYRYLHVNGLENIPKNKPIIFAANHQNALLDPLMVIFATNLQPVFLARADIFKKKFIARILNYLKIAPVYRMRDGKESLEKNAESFDTSVRILKNNRILALFPEGAHIGLKSMLPHKKAIPRIVFMAAENTNFDIDIQIVPVGINYSHYYKFGRDAVINFGKPIGTKNYYDLFHTEGEVKASNAMRDDLYKAIDQLVVNVPDKTRYNIYEQAFEIAKPIAANQLNIRNTSRNFVKIEKFISEKIAQYIEESDQQKIDDIQSKAQKYKELKQKIGVEELAIMNHPIRPFNLFLRTLAILLLLPFSVLGTLAHGWIFYLTRYPVRNFIKDPQFYSTFAFGLTLVFYPLWVIGLFFILLAMVNSWLWAMVLLVISFPSGLLAWELLQLIRHTIQALRLKKKTRHNITLLNLHQELSQLYNQILSD